MTNSKMMAQMAGQSGFIAALDQSGGSTPGALRHYGIPDSAYSGERQKPGPPVRPLRRPTSIAKQTRLQP